MMFIDKSTIYSNGKQSCGKTFVLPVLHRSLGNIEKKISPKLPDYFIHGLRNSLSCIRFQLSDDR